MDVVLTEKQLGVSRRSLLEGLYKLMIHSYHEKRKEGDLLSQFGLEELFFDLESFGDAVVGAASSLITGRGRFKFRFQLMLESWESIRFYPRLRYLIDHAELQRKLRLNFAHFVTIYSLYSIHLNIRAELDGEPFLPNGIGILLLTNEQLGHSRRSLLCGILELNRYFYCEREQEKAILEKLGMSGLFQEVDQFSSGIIHVAHHLADKNLFDFQGILTNWELLRYCKTMEKIIHDVELQQAIPLSFFHVMTLYCLYEMYRNINTELRTGVSYWK